MFCRVVILSLMNLLELAGWVTVAGCPVRKPLLPCAEGGFSALTQLFCMLGAGVLLWVVWFGLSATWAKSKCVVCVADKPVIHRKSVLLTLLIHWLIMKPPTGQKICPYIVIWFACQIVLLGPEGLEMAIYPVTGYFLLYLNHDWYLG